jgi:hypothetical protein
LTIGAPTALSAIASHSASHASPPRWPSASASASMPLVTAIIRFSTSFIVRASSPAPR